jgi:hypothetical protein
MNKRFETISSRSMRLFQQTVANLMKNKEFLQLILYPFIKSIRSMNFINLLEGAFFSSSLVVLRPQWDSCEKEQNLLFKMLIVFSTCREY